MKLITRLIMCKCVCGGCFQSVNMKQHFKTKKHLKYVLTDNKIIIESDNYFDLFELDENK